MKNFLSLFFFALAVIGAITVVNTVHSALHSAQHTVVESLK